MARISGNVSDSCKIIVLSEDFLNVERVIDRDGDYSIYGLEPSTSKTVIVRRSDGKSIGYKSVETVAHDIEISTPTLSVTGEPYTVYDNPTITSSAFNLISGNDTHYSTDWQILDEGGLVYWESLNDRTNKTSITLPSNTLQYQREYTFRCRYNCRYEGSSDWGEVQASTLVYLSNHSFENWTEGGPAGDDPDNWLFYDHNTNSGAVSKESNFKTDGSFSARLTRSGDNCCVYRVISDEKGIDYWRGRTITFRCYAGSILNNTARIRLYYGDISNAVYSSYAGGGGGLTFNLLSITTTIPIDATQVQISCWFENRDDDYVCFDKIEIVDHSVFAPFNENLRLYSFGDNTYGQLGTGNTTNTSAPTVVGTYEFKKIQKGDAHIIGIKNDRTLWGCGHNAYGNLGLGDIVHRSTFTKIGSDSDWIDISCGFAHTLALKTDGTLWACGYNNNGQLGLSHKNNVSTLTKVGTENNWNKIYSGNYHNFCIKNDGQLFGFGLNTSGQLGNNSRTGRSSPIQIGSLTDWLQLSCGSDHTVAVKKDGTLWAWGSNTYGQLGQGNRTFRSTPTKIGLDTVWISVASCNHSILATKSNGTLWSCGYNNVGQLGHNDVASKSNITQIGSSTSWKTMSGSGSHFVALMFDGTVWGVGLNSSGQLGLGNTNNRSTLTKIGSNTKWKKLVCFAGFGGTSTYLLESES